MSENELVDSSAPNPLSLGNGPRKNTPNDVPNLVHTGTEEKLDLIDPPLGMRLVPRGIDSGLPISLLPNEERPIRRGVNSGRQERRPVHNDNLRLPPPHSHSDARTGRPEVDRHPQCHPHPR
jgi:hypothetical protein